MKKFLIAVMILGLMSLAYAVGGIRSMNKLDGLKAGSHVVILVKNGGSLTLTSTVRKSILFEYRVPSGKEFFGRINVVGEER